MTVKAKIKNSLNLEWRSKFRYGLIVIWVLVFLSQIILYTSIAEVISYILLDFILIFVFLKFVVWIQSRPKVLGIIAVMSFILGLVPYKIRLADLTLIFFHSAKNELVTYYPDPYLNFSSLLVYLIFPIAHFMLMYAITRTYGKKPGQSGMALT